MRDFDSLLRRAAALRREDPELRLGQSVYLCAYDLWPLDCESLTGGGCDPFHDDSRVGAFLSALETMSFEDDAP